MAIYKPPKPKSFLPPRIKKLRSRRKTRAEFLVKSLKAQKKLSELDAEKEKEGKIGRLGKMEKEGKIENWTERAK